MGYLLSENTPPAANIRQHSGLYITGRYLQLTMVLNVTIYKHLVKCCTLTVLGYKARAYGPVASDIRDISITVNVAPRDPLSHLKSIPRLIETDEP